MRAPSPRPMSEFPSEPAVTHPQNPDLSQARNHCLTPDQAQQMAEFFSRLGDPNRLRILSLLAQSELCVGDLALALEMSESAVSHQLRVLKSSRLVTYRRQGRHKFYRLHDHHVLALYATVVEHLAESENP